MILKGWSLIIYKNHFPYYFLGEINTMLTRTIFFIIFCKNSNSFLVFLVRQVFSRSDIYSEWNSGQGLFRKAAFTRQTYVGKLVLANPSWCVWKAQKQAANNTFANCWRQIETCLATVFMPLTHTNLSLPTRVCQLKFAVWRPLKKTISAHN